MNVNKFRLKVDALGLDAVIENKRGIMVLPKNCTPYILFINNDAKHGWWRHFFLKPLLTLAETLARW